MFAKQPRKHQSSQLPPLRGPNQSKSAPVSPAKRGNFKALPRAGEHPKLPGGRRSTGQLRPRAELAAGGRTLTNRVHVLIGQASHVAAEVQRAAVQELMLLAGTSEASRREILAAGGDKQLMRLLQRCEVPAVQRSCLGALASLAADEWSRRRQQHALARAHVLLGADEGTAQDAAKLLANLVRSPAMQDAVHRIGAYARLQEVMSRNPADPAFDGLLTPRALVSSQPLSPIRSRPILESVPWDPLKKEEPPEKEEAPEEAEDEEVEMATVAEAAEADDEATPRKAAADDDDDAGGARAARRRAEKAAEEASAAVANMEEVKARAEAIQQPERAAAPPPEAPPVAAAAAEIEPVAVASPSVSVLVAGIDADAPAWNRDGPWAFVRIVSPPADGGDASVEFGLQDTDPALDAAALRIQAATAAAVAATSSSSSSRLHVNIETFSAPAAGEWVAVRFLGVEAPPAPASGAVAASPDPSQSFCRVRLEVGEDGAARPLTVKLDVPDRPAASVSLEDGSDGVKVKLAL